MSCVKKKKNQTNKQKIFGSFYLGNTKYYPLTNIAGNLTDMVEQFIVKTNMLVIGLKFWNSTLF